MRRQLTEQEKAAAPPLAEGILVVLALVLTAIPPNLLTLDLQLGVAMSRTAPILLPLVALSLIATYLLARRKGYRQLCAGLAVGVLAGAISTAAYDAFRLGGMKAGVIEHDEASDFGRMIAGVAPPAHVPMPGEAAHPSHAHGEPAPAVHADEHGGQGGGGSAWTTLVGYLYHYGNGAMFGLAFVLLFGRTRLWAPVLWATLFVYTGMVLVMGVHSWASFWVELAGHAGFGVVLGLLVRRFGVHVGLGYVRRIVVRRGPRLPTEPLPA